jgi:putative phosphoribosyl transferase
MIPLKTDTEPQMNHHREENRDPVREALIKADGANLRGDLRWIGRPRGVVVFAHGSGSSRHSPRNRFVADTLNRSGFATVLLDLLDEAEERDRNNVFDVDLLAGRLVRATDWICDQPELASLPTGYFGASTGSAAALIAATEQPTRVKAVVSRGGRPDLAGRRLVEVRAPTLLIVGGADEEVLELNQAAAARMTCETKLVVVPGATHLFPEPGALDEVARLAADWFWRYLAAG